MTPDELERIGRSIWYDRWKSPMSRALGVTVAWLGQYANGQASIPRAIDLASRYLRDNVQTARRLGAQGLKRGAPRDDA